MTDVQPESGMGRVAVIHHGFIPIYRIGFYSRLATYSDREYVVFHGEAPPNSGHLAINDGFSFPHVRVPNHELRLAGRSVIYQPLIREILTGGYGAVVMAGQLRFVSNLLLHPLMKLVGRPVIFWGHGRFAQHEDATGSAAALLRLTARMRAAHARYADVYFAYTVGGAEVLRGAGVPAEKLLIVPNTVDTTQQEELHDRYRDSDPAQLRADLGLGRDSLALLYLGRIYREKRLPELIEALRRIRERGLVDRPVELLVVGDGPALDEARAAAVGVEGIHFRGAVEDQDEIARSLRATLALVIPGGVGLAVNHAFAHGRPVLTRVNDMHGGEVEYIADGENGLVVPGDLDAFAEALAGFLNSPEQQRRLADGALATRDSLSLDAMVAAFDSGVAQVLAGRFGAPGTS